MGDLVMFSDVVMGDRVKLPGCPWITVETIKFAQNNVVQLHGRTTTGTFTFIAGYDYNHVKRISYNPCQKGKRGSEKG